MIFPTKVMINLNTLTYFLNKLIFSLSDLPGWYWR